MLQLMQPKLIYCGVVYDYVRHLQDDQSNTLQAAATLAKQMLTYRGIQYQPTQSAALPTRLLTPVLTYRGVSYS
jgi:hypothetical protein